MIDCGKMNKRLIFQAGTESNDGEGKTVWTDSFSVWAAVIPLVGNRRYLAQQLDSSISGTIIIRYRSDVKSSMRIKYGSRYLSIISIRDPEEAHISLEIDYSERID
jgi:SPP1 family predicted phage head-tail adaptor